MLMFKNVGDIIIILPKERPSILSRSEKRKGGTTGADKRRKMYALLLVIIDYVPQKVLNATFHINANGVCDSEKVGHKLINGSLRRTRNKNK